MKVFKIRNVWILKWFKIEGMVIYPIIFFASSEPHAFLEKHEEIHIDQIRRDGILTFYFRYLWEYFINRRKGLSHDQAYRFITYEKEAYLNHHLSDYQVTAKIEKTG